MCKQVSGGRIGSFMEAASKLFGDQLTCDIVINGSGECTWSAHKAILCARSEVFRAMLTSNMAESAKGEICIPGHSAEAMGCFLRFLYTDNCDATVFESVHTELLELAHKYQVPL